MRSIFVACVFLFSISPASARVIVSENFDAITDWRDVSATESCAVPDCTDTNKPDKFDFYNNREYWLPATGYQDNPPTNIIDGTNPRGGAGKSYTHWVESTHGSTWQNDGMIGIYIPDGETELWIEFWQKFQINFLWRIDPGSSIKNFRVYHWDGSGHVYDFFSDGHAGPLVQYYPGKNSAWDGKFEISLRCAPQDTNYYCSGDTDDYYFNQPFVGGESFEEYIGDGNWHKYRFHLKMNTAPGIEDGIFELYIDDRLEFSKTDIPWLYTSDASAREWNVIQFGGNANNIWADDSELSEQWYAIDDVCVATEQADLNGCIKASFNHGSYPSIH